ncbi:GNAT family N-acetyltransferase [Nitrincola sp. A-D6]|uniref:GNAT family N-acetyltransferase n=1 Tax=Nitrincola sp. A-D6 TaxID=1545442 RepID=UPI0009E00309|nr:GNAT family N-acetyltransferase [Nitrincola sp. A-D6]
MHHREVAESDIPEICKLSETREELFYCYPSAAFPLSEAEVRQSIEKRSDSTVVEVAGQVVAFANFYRWEKGLCSIGNVVVASGARGSGVGRYLINHMLKLGFEKHRAKTVSVSCFNRNVAGLLFYPKLGFQPYGIEQRVDYNGDRVALIHLKIEQHAT